MGMDHHVMHATSSKEARVAKLIKRATAFFITDYFRETYGLRKHLASGNEISRIT
jgi:hypothetical protein